MFDSGHSESPDILFRVREDVAIPFLILHEGVKQGACVAGASRAGYSRLLTSVMLSSSPES